MSRREFANLKELQDFARRNRKLYALEETAKFAGRQRRLSPDQRSPTRAPLACRPPERLNSDLGESS
jgi:hypothetical protein